MIVAEGYWKVLDNIEKLIKENEKLSLLLQNSTIFNVGSDLCEPASCLSSCTNILKEMIHNAEKNCGKYRTHRRHPEILKKSATALFLFAGPLAYEFIQQNMPKALPCIRTAQSAI